MAIYMQPARTRRGSKKIKRDKLVDLWEARLYDAEEVKRKWKEEFQVDALKLAYEGFQKPDTWDSDEWFTLNLVFSSMRVLRRTVVPKDLKVNIELRRSMFGDKETIAKLNAQARIRTAFHQYLVDQQVLWKIAQKAYRNAHWSFGVVKSGYSSFMEKNDRAGLPVEKNGNVLIGDDGRALIEPKEVVAEEEFFYENVSPELFLVDKDASEDLDRDCRWCAQKFFKSVSEVKRNKRYRNTSGLTASELTTEEIDYLDRMGENPGKTLQRPKFDDGEDEEELVVLYEIYDLVNKQKLTIARGHIKPLEYPAAVPKSLFWGHPFSVLKFYDRQDKFYPIPVIHNWMGPQFEYNVRRNLLAGHIKKANAKYLADANKIDDSQIEQFLQNKDVVVVKVDGPPVGIIAPVEHSHVGNEHLFDTNLLKGEFDEISGVGKQQRGEGNAESATEAEISESRASAGEKDDHTYVMLCLEEAIQRMNALCEEFLTLDGVIKWSGPRGAEFVNFGPEAFEPIDGEFLFQMTTEEATRGTLMVERSQLLQFVEVFSSNPLLAQSPALVRAIADKFPSLANNEELIEEVVGLSRMAVQMQMMQSQGPSVGKKGSGEKTSRPREVAEQSRKSISK